MKKKTTGFQKTAIGLLAGLIVISLLLIMPVSAVTGEIVAWGRDNAGQNTVQPGSNYTQVSAGGQHNLALREDGTMVAWGWNNDDQGTAQPGSNYTHVSAGSQHSLALREDGTMVAWKFDGGGAGTTRPGNNFIQVSAGALHNLALREDGSMVAWGDNDNGRATAQPGNNYTQVSAGGSHNLALREDGTMVAWGDNDKGQTDVPSGSNYTQVSAGGRHCMALREDGTMVAWGDNMFGQATVQPGNNFTQVSAGWYHSLALREDGSMVAWGWDSFGQATAQPGNDYIQVSAGGWHSLAIKAVPSAPTPAPVASITGDSSCDEGSEIFFDASGSLNTVAGTTYVWTFGDGTGGSGVNALHPYEQDGEYDVTLTVTNPDGKTDSTTASITVANAAPTIDSFTMPGTVSVGVTVNALAHFSDPGTDDMHTATLNWGDLTGDDTGCTLSEDTGDVSGAHAYTASGEYQVALTVTDNDGGSATRSTMITVTEIQTPEPTITPTPEPTITPTPEPTVTQTPEPTDSTNAPEFPTLAVPSMLIVGLAGVVLLARRKE